MHVLVLSPFPPCLHKTGPEHCDKNLTKRKFVVVGPGSFRLEAIAIRLEDIEEFAVLSLTAHLTPYQSMA